MSMNLNDAVLKVLADNAKTINIVDAPYSHDVQKKGITDISLRDNFTITAEFLLYTLDNNEPTLYIADKKYNLILSNLDKASKQFKEENNYFPKNLDISAIIKDSSTKKIKLNNLDLKKYNNEWHYFDINTSNYDKLNTTQRDMAEQIHGLGNKFKEVMNMLNNSGIYAARVYVLNPEYITKILKENNESSLARLGYLGNFSCESYFDAGNRSI